MKHNPPGKLISLWALLLCCLLATEVSAQWPTPYTSYKRFTPAGQLTGEIMPATLPDSAASHYQARRYTYNAQGLLIKTETGVLRAWLDETIQPKDWQAYTGFELIREVHTLYDSRGRKIRDQVLSNGVILKVKQYSYYDHDQLHCETVRMNPASFNALPPSACTLGTPGSTGRDRITRYSYDNRLRNTRIEKAVGTPLVQTYVTNEYNGNNALTAQIDANGNRTELRYDTRRRLERMVFPHPTLKGSVNETDYEQYTYDNNSNRTHVRKRDTRLINYTYDNRNRVGRKVPPVNEDILYEYNNLGLQTYARFGYDASRGVRFGYDGFGRLISETNTTTGTAFTIANELDEEGLVRSITYPDGQKFHYAYNGLGQLTQLRDNTGNLISQSYTDDGLPYTQTLANGAKTDIRFDGLKRLESIAHNLNGTSNDVTYDFQYNPAGQITRFGLNNSLYHAQNSAQTYRFSNQNTYTVNGLNQYTGFTNNGTQNLEYDPNGNLTRFKQQTPAADIYYTYDGENRMTAVSGSQGARLKYDPLGRLYEYTAGGITTRFLHSGDAVIAEYNTSSTMQKRYVHAPGGEAPLLSYTGSSIASSNREFLHFNHQGSVVAISNSSGIATTRNTYDEYGIPGTANKGRFGYTGQMYLPELGLYHYKARVYSPSLGRFLQTDPVGYADQMNLYAYVGNDPVNMVDPTGMTTDCAETGTCPPPEPPKPCICNIGKPIVEALNKVGEMLKGAMKSEGVPAPAGDRINQPDGAESEVSKPGDSTLRPGAHAGESIPARGSGRDFTPEEREKINGIGEDTGCHTCGTTDPGTNSGNFVPDHQPPSALNPPGGAQELYPHCIGCSRVQGGQVRGTQLRKR